MWLRAKRDCGGTALKLPKLKVFRTLSFILDPVSPAVRGNNVTTIFDLGRNNRR